MGTIGSRVRLLRKKQGLTQAALAQRVGITQGSLSLIENNQTEMPAGETLAGLCQALRTTPDFLVAGAGDPDSIEAAMMEHELVFLWRSLPANGRQMVLDAAQSAKRALVGQKEPHK
jgi:transcriptional regulator with XRE-family HTH domain